MLNLCQIPYDNPEPKPNSQPKINPRLLKVSDAAAYLNLSREMVYQMVTTGELPSTRIGRAIRLDKIVLDRWIERKTKGGII